MRCGCLLFLIFLGAAATQPIQWHNEGVSETRLLDLSHFDREQFINAEAKEDGLHVTLPRAGYSYVLLTDRFDYSEKAVMQLKLAAIEKGNLTVQAVCYDVDGRIFTSFDLVDYIESKGTFEIPL